MNADPPTSRSRASSARAPFIWTSKQKIDADGFFSAIRGAPPRSDGLNRWFLFRRRINLDCRPDRGWLDVTCDGKYQLFINGARIGRGPVRCSPLFQRYDRYEDVSCFRAGENVIGLLVHTYGADTAFYEGVHGHWRETFGDGALWIDGELGFGAPDDNRASVMLRSDLDWRAYDCDAWDTDTPQVNSGLGFVESIDARRFPVGWSQAGFDDTHWDEVQILTAGGGGPEARFGGAVTRPYPLLKLSEMPQQSEVFVPPVAIAWARDVEVRAAPIIEQAYAEPLGSRLAEVEAECAVLARAGADGARIVTAPGRGVAILFDFAEIQAGRPTLEIHARGGEVFDIVVSERLPGEFEPGGIGETARIERKPLLGLDAHVSRYVARAGRQVFETFEWDAVRWLQLTVREAPQGVQVRNLGVVATRFPARPSGQFECSDALLTHLWGLGRKTIDLCMHDGWIDCPSREQRQWLGDATVEHLVGEAVYGPQIHQLNRHFLRSAAESQRPDGLLEMFAPGDHRRFGWLIPDFTLQWIFNVADHFDHSGDRELLVELFPALLKAIGWFERLQGEDGRIADLPYWHFQDWAAVGRTGFATVLNAELLGALRIAGRLSIALGWPGRAAQFAGNAERLARALEAHWDEERSVYVDVVDPQTGALERRVSQHANAAMMLWADLTQERMTVLAQAIGDRARLRLTPAPPVTLVGEPFDPEIDIVLANTFFSHFVYEALARAGRLDLALALMRERYGGMASRGATTLWEGFEPHTSLAHGFSATPTWQLSRHVLGVMPAAPGFARVRIRPNLGDLDFAHGIFPTVNGDVAVAIKRVADDLDVEVSLPQGMSGIIEPPAGYRLEGDGVLASGRNRRRLRAVWRAKTN
ncbi:MAG: alpha-L-rhamnosidase N-terminal domain-containing protein [Hyphomonadaceae bacterium]|nr:MAG: alpha-L-rhamnosidase [Caulobacteraceae bacterium]MBT9444127.1 alpha-L-rhamnosidase N-terminal domain-containing protein [Hyphomonadaceae bacterium]TPW07752.1 MAG: alpha-L-rhamnosidase [Alphaproteobacteria bacterium]